MRKMEGLPGDRGTAGGGEQPWPVRVSFARDDGRCHPVDAALAAADVAAGRSAAAERVTEPPSAGESASGHAAAAAHSRLPGPALGAAAPFHAASIADAAPAAAQPAAVAGPAESAAAAFALAVPASAPAAAGRAAAALSAACGPVARRVALLADLAHPARIGAPRCNARPPRG